MQEGGGAGCACSYIQHAVLDFRLFSTPFSFCLTHKFSIHPSGPLTCLRQPVRRPSWTARSLRVPWRRHPSTRVANTTPGPSCVGFLVLAVAGGRTPHRFTYSTKTGSSWKQELSSHSMGPGSIQRATYLGHYPENDEKRKKKSRLELL